MDNASRQGSDAGRRARAIVHGRTAPVLHSSDRVVRRCTPTVRVEHASRGVGDGTHRCRRGGLPQRTRSGAPCLGCRSNRIPVVRRRSARWSRAHRSDEGTGSSQSGRASRRGARTRHRGARFRVLAIPRRVAVPDRTLDTCTPPGISVRARRLLDTTTSGTSSTAAAALRAEPSRTPRAHPLPRSAAGPRLRHRAPRLDRPCRGEVGAGHHDAPRGPRDPTQRLRCRIAGARCTAAPPGAKEHP